MRTFYFTSQYFEFFPWTFWLLEAKCKQLPLFLTTRWSEKGKWNIQVVQLTRRNAFLSFNIQPDFIFSVTAASSCVSVFKVMMSYNVCGQWQIVSHARDQHRNKIFIWFSSPKQIIILTEIRVVMAGCFLIPFCFEAVILKFL